MSPRPLPRPGVLEIEAYVPGKSGAPGVAKVHKLSSNETPLGPAPAGDRGGAARRRASSNSIPTARRPRCARRSRASYGLDPARIVCGAGSDELLALLTQAYVGPGDEGMFTEHGFLVYRIAILAAGGTPVVAPESDLTADVDAILAAGDAADQDRLPRQPEQPDRHLPAVRRGEAPARRAAAARAARARRGLCRICPPQRLRGRPRARRDGRERRDDAHLLEDLRPRRLRLGWMVGPAHVVDAVNRIRGPFNVNGPAIAAGIAALADEAHVGSGRRAQRALAALADARDRGARA